MFQRINNNTIDNVVVNGTSTSTAGVLRGIYSNTSTAAGVWSETYNNTVSNLSFTGTHTGTVHGIFHLLSSNAIYRNKITGLSASGSAGAVRGIELGSGATNNVFNNIIGDLFTPANASSTAAAPSVRGIFVNSTTTLSTINLTHNTVNISGTSSGTNFGTAALFANGNATATTANVVMRNNILANTATPTGVGLSVAYQRSSTALNNYDNASNNNLFYAGTPSATTPIFYDGTTAQQTLANFKTAVAPREAGSISENPTWVSTSGAAATYLHINTTVAFVVNTFAVFN